MWRLDAAFTAAGGGRQLAHGREAMIVADHVPHALLIERFRLAVEMFSMDARADELPRYVRNLHQAERDLFGVEETEIELPDWI